MDYEKIGKFISERRKELNLTQKQLGEKINVTDKAVSKWERGLGCPDVSILGELSEVLNVGIGEILNGEYNEDLKDNTEFVKKVVNYSKQITEDNIYLKIRKVLYFILIIIVICMSYMGVKQFISMNNGINFKIEENDFVYQEYQKLNSNYKVIKENKYLVLENKTNVYKDGDYSNIIESLILNIEDSNILSLDNDKRYVSDIANMQLVFNEIYFINYFLSDFLSKNDSENSKYYAILAISENTYLYDDLSILTDGETDVYIEDMYDYDNIKNNINIENYYDILNVRLMKINKMLELVIELGDENV